MFPLIVKTVRNGAAAFFRTTQDLTFFYIYAEGFASYQALYLSNNCAPLTVAIIRPGTGFGCNWTDYKNQKMIFARTVLDNPQGKRNI